MLPYRWQVRIGHGLGAILWRLPLSTQHVARVNLRLCFPELDDGQREALLRKHYAALGMSLVEIAMSWWSSSRALQPLAQIEGLEHLQRALEKGKGAILLSAHFTTLEIGGRLLALHAPFAVMYRHQKNRVFDEAMREARERNFAGVIHRGDVRTMLRTLRKNIPVWYAPDQNFGGKQHAFVDFFGIPASTNTATSRIAAVSGAPVVPFFQLRLPGDQGYRLILQPALENFPSDDPIADSQRINQVIEQQVRAIPEQYFWVHRRFKRRPPGEQDVYAAKPSRTKAP